MLTCGQKYWMALLPRFHSTINPHDSARISVLARNAKCAFGGSGCGIRRKTALSSLVKKANFSNFLAQDTDQLHQMNMDDLRSQGPEGPKEGVAEERKKIDDSEHTMAQEIETVPNPVRS